MSEEHEIRKGMWAGLRQADMLGCTHAAEGFREALGLNAFTDPAPQPAASEIKAENARLKSLLASWVRTGCPDCSGDCASANPPVSCCIMRETHAALAEGGNDG